MDTATFTTLLSRPGPYASVMVDVSQDSETAAHGKELRVRAACEELGAQGAPEPVLIDPDALAGRSLDPADHPGLSFGAAPVSGPVPAAEALVAAAVVTDAEVCPLPADVLGDVPVAGLLRWAG